MSASIFAAFVWAFALIVHERPMDSPIKTGVLTTFLKFNGLIPLSTTFATPFGVPDKKEHIALHFVAQRLNSYTFGHSKSATRSNSAKLESKTIESIRPDQV